MKKEFKISSELYFDEKINEAIEAFSDIGDISFSNGKISISGENNEEINEIFNELMNYIVGLISQ